MKWFEGSINDAVTASKQRKAIFVVFVDGKDDTSSHFKAVIDEPQISERLEGNDFVAIRVESDEQSYTFFKQIYQIVPVPSLFFIGLNGAPVEVVNEAVTSSDLSNKIDSVLEKVGKAPGSSSTNLINAEQSGSIAANVSKASSVTEESVAPASPSQRADGAADGAKELSHEEKLERAKTLIELQRQQRIDKEREDERTKELMRRKVAKDVEDAKRKQREMEMKIAYEEIQREKVAEAAARKKAQQRILEDKIERKQKALELQEQIKLQQQNQQREVETSAGPPAGKDDVRIQFRLPSGSPHTQKFESTTTLGTLRAYVAMNIELPFRNFAMSTTFPRKDLTSADDDKTLTELELVPSAVILILPTKGAALTKTEDIGFVWRFIMAFFTPIFSVYNSVVGYFTGRPASPPEAVPDGTNVAAGGTQKNSNTFGQSASSTSGNPFGGRATTIRSRGNIHGLHTGGADNDENNTWNGNSTQQM